MSRGMSPESLSKFICEMRSHVAKKTFLRFFFFFLRSGLGRYFHLDESAGMPSLGIFDKNFHFNCIIYRNSCKQEM